MAAATQSRNTMFRNVRGVRTVPLKAAAKVYKCCLVATDATGFGIAGATATGLICAGLALADVDNTAGGSGALSVDVLLCEAYLGSDGTVDQTNFDASVFIVDDQTVAKAAGGTKSAAGNCTGFDAG